MSETLDFNVSVSKDDLLEFLDSHAQDGVDVFGQLPEDESIQINIHMIDGYNDVEFELSYDEE
jgi:phosphopantetheinyl transferase